jgi:hypothetical protein
MPRKPRSDGSTPPVGDNGIGHNGSAEEPTDALGQVIAECYLGYAQLAGERTAINWDIAAHFDKFEARGIKAKEKKAIKAAYSDAHNADKSSAKDQHRANIRVKLALGHITLADATWTTSVSQASLFPDATAQGEIAYRTAYDEGRKASAVQCLVKSLNPNARGTRSFEGWDDGWNIGASDRANAGLDAPDRTERKKPGRPAKAADGEDSVLDEVGALAATPAKRGRKASPAAAAVEALQAQAERLGGDMPADPA